MTMMTPARRRQGADFQALLAGGRASSPAAAADLSPLVALAGALAPVDHAPDAGFRAALRTRLVAAAAARVPAPAVPARPTRPARPSAPSRLRQVVATVVVAAVVAGVGAAAASTRALPGGTLYGLKRQIEAGQLALARGDLGHGRELLEQADARLTEAERLTAGEHGGDPATRARVGQALREMGADATAGAADLTRAYRDTGDEQAMVLLDRFVVEQRERLADLLGLLDPSLRDLVRSLADQLARLGEQTAAVLGAASALAPQALTADGDGWAVSRLLDAASAGASGTAGVAGAGAAGPIDDVLGAVGGVTGGAVGDDGSSAGGSGDDGSGGGLVGGVVGSLTGGSTSSSSTPSLLPSALPSVSLAPLPTGEPLVTDPVGAVTSAAPLATSSPASSVSLCVPVPPLITC
jgi:hypothetical protein